MKYELKAAGAYEKWFNGLKDRSTKNKILARLARIENGNFGDFKPLKQSLFELRFVFGGGVRIYYTIRNDKVVLLLNGGDKSGQSKDIAKARKLIDEMG